MNETSKKFQLRLAALDRNVFRHFMSLAHEERQEVDREFERNVGMSCDAASDKLGKDEFMKVALAAIEKVKKKKKQGEAVTEDESSGGMKAVA